jgi:hypothetical protein
VQDIDGNRQLVHVGDERRGVHAPGIVRKRPVISGPAGGNAVLPSNRELIEYFRTFAHRLRRVRVCCGDWSRVCGPSVTHKHGLTAVFLDPPYADTAGRADNLYRKDCDQVAHAAREWAIIEGWNPLMRIALCGYEGEHVMPDDWECVSWNAGMGYGGQNAEQTGNGKKERVWFSPHCEKDRQPNLL